MAVYSIEYDEPDVSTYKHVKISYGENQKKIFDSGDFVKDWYNLIKFIVLNLEEYPIVGSSSVDHFFMDGANDLYDVAYLVPDENDETKLVYERKGEDFIELYVPKGMQPTWEELKILCQ